MRQLKRLTHACCLVLFLALPLAVGALGQTTDPIVIDNALRGEDFQEELIIINTEDKNITVEIKAEGQVADWAKFYKPDDLQNPISEANLAASEKLNLFVRFSIPQDVANGDYTGVIAALQKPGAEATGENASVLTQRIDREVTIKVSDQENVSLVVSVIPASYDVKIGDPLKIKLLYDNQGNISLAPQVDLKIKKINTEEVVFNVIYPYPEGEEKVRPSAQKEISNIEVATDKLEAGKYTAELTFLHNGQTVSQESFNFSTQSAALNTTTIIIIVVVVVIVAALSLIRRQKKVDLSN